jgi:hypothetical protein
MRRTRIAQAVTALGLVLGLAACGTPPWQDPAYGGTPEAHAAAVARPAAVAASTPTPSAKPRPSPKPEPSPTPAVQNDLAEGSAQREVTAGAALLRLKYWSTTPLEDWGAGASKPLTINVAARGGGRVQLGGIDVVVDAQTRGGGGWPSTDATSLRRSPRRVRTSRRPRAPP